MNLRAVAIIRFVFTTLLVVVAMSVVTIVLLMSYVPEWSDSVQKTLTSNEKAALQSLAESRSELISNHFRQSIVDTTTLVDYTQGLLVGTKSIRQNYTSFSTTLFNSDGTRSVSTKSTFVFNKFDSRVNLANSSLLDDAFRAVQLSTQNYYAVYFGDTYSLHRQFPWQYLPHYATNRYTCARDNSAITGYDPTCRGWYVLADRNPNKVVLTQPYEDAASGDLLITAAMTVNDPTNSNTTLGVIGIDLSIAPIRSALSVSVLSDGYWTLMGTDGIVAVYPGLDPSSVLTFPQAAQMSTAETLSFMNTTLPAMIANGKGEFEISVKGAKVSVPFSLVNGTDFIVFAVVPLETIQKPATDIDSSSSNTVTAAIIVLVIVVVAVAVVGFFVVAAVTTSVTQPINAFYGAARRVADGDLNVNLDEVEAQSAELLDLRENFYIMLLSITTTRDDFVAKHPQKARQGFLFLGKAMLSRGNLDWPLSTVLNNTGVAISLSKDYENRDADAQRCMAYSMKLGERSLATEMGIDPTFVQKRLAERRRKLGESLIKSDHAAGMAEMHRSMEDCKALDNRLGTIHALGALVRYDQKYYSLLATASVDPTFEPNLQQTALIYLGELCLEGTAWSQIDANAAATHFRRALEMSPSILPSLRRHALYGLRSAYALLNDEVMVSRLDSVVSVAAARAPLRMAFVLDCSYSMRCQYDGKSIISVSRDCIANIVNDDNLISEGDMASLITFGNDSEVTVPMTKIDSPEAKHAFTHQVQNNTDLRGATAFYDAMGDAVQQIAKTSTKEAVNNVVIGLTDGEDNMSASFDPHSLSRLLKKHSTVSVYVITVGNISTASDIARICDASANGEHLSADNVSQINEKFDAAMSAVMAMGALES